MKMVMKACLDRTSVLIDELIVLWADSVRASHDFLGEDDIKNLTPYVKIGLGEIERLITIEIDHKTVGFMGIAQQKIEMLFIAPACFRQGIGRALVDFAKADGEIKWVDVNEQNPKARLFYERMGFAVYERSPLDDQGNAFPILKMRLVEAFRGN